jgi:hypothetical protein
MPSQADDKVFLRGAMRRKLNIGPHGSWLTAASSEGSIDFGETRK